MSMQKLMSNYHELSGRPLPIVWTGLNSYERIAVCKYWRSRNSSRGIAEWLDGYKLWKTFKHCWPQIYSHLQAIGELETRSVPYTTFRPGGKSYVQDMVAEAYRKASEGVDSYRKAHGEVTKVWFDESSRVAQPAMLYERPNGGQRTLPSVYGRLRGNDWMRANRAMQSIDEMNDGHLENTLKLLLESHGNIQAKTTTLLGKMWHHYQNQPEIQRRLEELCLLMQKVEVHEMYPIFGTLAREQASRVPKYYVSLDIETQCFDDSVRNW